MKERLRLKPDDTGVIFAGQLYKNNNVDQLLYYWKKCVKSTDTLRLIIAGDGPQMNYLKNLALEYGIMSQVTFTGRIEHLFCCMRCIRQRNRLYDHEGFPAGSNCVRRAGHYPKEKRKCRYCNRRTKRIYL